MGDSDLKTCTKCERELPGTTRYYHRMSKASDGLRYRCKECRGSDFGYGQSSSVPDVPDGKKMCIGCERILPAEPTHFEQTRRTNDGLIGRCKECRGTRKTFGVSHPNQVYDTPDGKKYCTACMELYPADPEHFIRNKSSKDGLMSQCKKCADRGGFETTRINQVRETPEGMKYCSTCKELLPANEGHFPKTSARGLRSQCHDCRRETVARSYQKHREERLEWQREYHQTDRWKAVLARAKARRRSRLAEAEHTLTAAEWVACKTEWRTEDGDVLCAYCGEVADPAERDHYIAVASGGGTTASNVVPACRSCNNSKNNSDPDEWYPRQEFYDKDQEQKIDRYLANAG